VAEGVRPPLYSEVWRAVFICRRASCPVYSYYESTLTSGGQADISLVGTVLEDKMEILDIRMPAFYLGPSNTAGKVQHGHHHQGNILRAALGDCMQGTGVTGLQIRSGYVDRLWIMD